MFVLKEAEITMLKSALTVLKLLSISYFIHVFCWFESI